jgi:protoheme IX farnesyltransferase
MSVRDALRANQLALPEVEPQIVRLVDYIALTKPRLNALVVATTAAGWYLGRQDHSDPTSIAAAVVGTALVAGGAAALNQVLERDTDALMRRTRSRPLPAGRVSITAAAAFGLALTSLGIVLLATDTTLVAAALALLTSVVYLLIYTPLKRRTPGATLVGAVPGALPPLIGWAASHGNVSPGGVALSAIVFLWQIPHFMAIAWLCRDDYAHAGFPMLPVIEPDGRRTGRNAVGYAAALLPVSLVPSIVGMSGPLYAATAVTLGVGFIWLAARFASARSDSAARALFLGSIAYLPLLWMALLANRS